ncbi:MAG TPA: metallophosphoesterase family protein [Candidatus Absconditabacterales bacterium]|nr:metallophosphoesterase family protein [Candidatus Absconditabacterales bacterium]
MLLIGDLHINSRVKDRVIDGMRKYIQYNDDEKNIVFLGDYVYHFSYDRVALLQLYNFFLELFSQGKNVYVLAGNHDWIGSTFVFEEAKRTFETINKVKSEKPRSSGGGHGKVKSDGRIEFITKPKVENIEGKDVLFLPYFIEAEECRVQGAECRDGIEGEIGKVIKTLSESKKKNEKISAKVNQILLDYVKKYDNLTIIHHYYIEGVNFPGQRGRFYFGDIAISKLFCELPNIKMISGHLHQGFVYKNYFCTGSVRHTSPLEVNQVKMFFKYSNEGVEGKMFFVNPYFLVSEELKVQSAEGMKLKVDEEFVENFIEKMTIDNKENYSGSEIWNIDFDPEYKIENKDISISVKVEDVSYDEIYNYIDEELFKKLKDVKLKKNMVVSQDLFEKLDTEGKNLSQGFSDWKGLLKDYLTNKYPEDFDKYLDFLKEEKIL